MSRNGLGILALLLAIGAIGLGGYGFYSLGILTAQTTDLDERTTDVEDETDRDRIYSDTAASQATNPASTMITVTGLRVDFEVESGDIVLFTYTCDVQIYTPSGSDSMLLIYFKLDGTTIGSPYTEIEFDDHSANIYHRCSGILRLVDDDLKKGDHYLEVVIYGDQIQNQVLNQLLTVEVY